MEIETATMEEEIEFCLLFAARVFEEGSVACRKDQGRILGFEREGFENGVGNREASDFVADRILDRMAPMYRHAAHETDSVVVNVGDCRSHREKVTGQVGRLADNFLLLGGRQICRSCYRPSLWIPLSVFQTFCDPNPCRLGMRPGKAVEQIEARARLGRGMTKAA
jgi:hypothetical protein